MRKSRSSRPASEPSDDNARPAYRCPACDSLVPAGATQCLMCGTVRPATEAVQPAESVTELAPETAVLKTAASDTAASETEMTAAASSVAGGAVESVVRSRRSSLFFWVTAAITFVLLGTAWSAFRGRAPEIMAAFIPTTTPLPPTVTHTPTWTPIPTETLPPSSTPTETPVPSPTSTLPPPRSHTISAGETLYGLSLLYRVSPESIAAANGFDVASPIQAGQALVIPWPTPRPPLESMILEVNGQTIAADVANCNIVTIQSGDSAYGLAAANNIPLEALIAVNGYTAETIQFIQPGDTLCIPRLVQADTLPPTPGPSPTPSLTPPPPGPSLLLPVQGAQIDGSGNVFLQWTAVKNLADDEWYMIEMRDAEARDMLPIRGFTRDSSYRVPSSWRPTEPQPHLMEWTVSIVRVTGRRTDGAFIYTFGGQKSFPSSFVWVGAPPTATPTPTATPQPSPTP